MILIDEALAKREKQGNPIRVGMVGAGFMGKPIALQISKYTKGMRLAAIANRHTNKAERAYEDAGIGDVTVACTQHELDSAIKGKKYVVTEDPLLLARSSEIDIILEVTGTVDYACGVVLEALKHKKHIAVMNAELDGTLGPILKNYADKAGVIYTNTDGDQPGVEMNLYRFLTGIGVTPVLCGNIKGLQDPYRTPETQKAFASKWGQKPHMVTSFADGTKISFEQAVVANATGMHVAKRGMWAPTVPAGTPLKEAVNRYPQEEILNNPGIVDYIVGAEPNSGVFVLGVIDDPVQKFYLDLYKVGKGPLYLFYNPYHLCHFEAPITLARAVLFNDATLTPKRQLACEVITVAKKDLRKGEVLDGIGGFASYGVIENYTIARNEKYLPMGLSEGCVLTRDIPTDSPIAVADVVRPSGRLSDELRKEQDALGET